VAASTSVLAALLFVACGGSSGHSASPAPPSTSVAVPATTPTTLPDVAPTAASFVNINSMTRVDDHFVGSLNGHLAAALAVAHSKNGGVYPVGTVIQLVPQEAMVKRYKGYSPGTNDWEMFSLKVSAQGTKIVTAGKKNVVNQFGLNCASCHAAAGSRFDFVCGKTHGCTPLPLTDAIIAAVQKGDPRPRLR
jgi:hypothetical protein